MLLPIEASLSLFGSSELSVMGFFLCCSLGSIVLTYLLGKRLLSPQVGLIGSALVAVFPLDVYCATTINSDMPLVFFGSAAILCWLVSDERAQQRRAQAAVGYAALAGLAVGGAYLTKVSGAFILFVIVGWALGRRRLGWNLCFVLAGFLAVIAAELLLMKLTTGHPFFRLYVIKKGFHTALIKEAYPTSREKLYRIFVAIPSMLANPLDQWAGFFFPSYHLVALGAVYLLIKKEKRALGLAWWWSAFFLLFSFNVFLVDGVIYPASLSQPRSLHPLTLPALLVAAFALTRLGRSQRRLVIPVVALVLGTSALFSLRVLQFDTRKQFSNTRAIVQFLQTHDPAPVYADQITLEATRFFIQSQNQFPLHDFSGVDLRKVTHGYVIEDRKALERLDYRRAIIESTSTHTLYKKWYFARDTMQDLKPIEHQRPDIFLDPPPRWEVVKTIVLPRRKSLRRWLMGKPETALPDHDTLARVYLIKDFAKVPIK
jgi:4-amino-4-deoxy-L-arabinose transferase-like glycosyltransferase